MNRTVLAFLLGILLVSCKAKEDSKRDPILLIFGNSITKHPPRPEIGWYGNWGMAASTENKDFSHIIGASLKAQVSPVNISEFELFHTSFDLKKLDKHFIDKPEWIIIKIGENVLQPKDFDKSFARFITYVKEMAPAAKLIIAGTFWQNDPVNKVLTSEAQARKIPFVKLQHLDTQDNKSFIGEDMFSADGSKYKISNQDVANHPGDVGMKNIADLILVKIDSISKAQ